MPDASGSLQHASEGDFYLARTFVAIIVTIPRL